MGKYCKVGNAEQELKWAWIWFKQFSALHHRRVESQQEFTMDEVIEFLRSRRDAKMPGWKRMKIIESLMTFRLKVQNVSADDLVPPSNKESISQFSFSPLSNSLPRKSRRGLGERT